MEVKKEKQINENANFLSLDIKIECSRFNTKLKDNQENFNFNFNFDFNKDAILMKPYSICDELSELYNICWNINWKNHKTRGSDKSHEKCSIETM